MVKINKLLMKHEGFLDRVKATFTDRDSLKTAKQTLKEKDVKKVKEGIHKIGVEKFVKLYDDKILDFLKSQLKIITQFEKTVTDSFKSYNSVKTLKDFKKVISKDPIFKYLDSDNKTLSKLGIISDPTVIEYHRILGESNLTKDGTKLSEFILKLYDQDIIGNSFFDKDYILKSIEKIKSKAKITESELLELLTLGNSDTLSFHRIVRTKKRIRNSFIAAVTSVMTVATVVAALTALTIFFIDALFVIMTGVFGAGLGTMAGVMTAGVTGNADLGKKVATATIDGAVDIATKSVKHSWSL